jgi:hypothetical protein
MMKFRRLALGFGVSAFSVTHALAQSSPNWTYGFTPSPAQWNQAFANKQDALNYTPVNKGGDTMVGPLRLYPSTTAGASLSMPPGAAPASPSNGDIWNTTAGFWLYINNQALNLFGGTSVGNPGTGGLEALMPVQTVSGASKTFATADLYKETRRSNSGSAMTDTFPAYGAAGLINGTRIVVTNFDATASDTVTAGSGTTINGGSTDVVGPGRAIQYVYDQPNLTWRRSLNTGSALLSANNLSDVASATTALGNLNGLPKSGGTMTGALITVASGTGAAGFNIPPGTAPTSPNNGDRWTTASGVFAQYGAATHQLAPTDSPALTGSPTAPTQGLGDNSTKLATTAYVATNAVSAVSPAFSGTPTAPTASVGTNTTQLATTGFVFANTRVLLSTLSCATTTNCNLGGTMTDTTHITATYSEYDLVVENCLSNAATNLIIQVKVGGSFQTTGYVGTASAFQGPTATSGTTFTTGLPLFYNTNSATVPASSTTHFSNPTGSGITTFQGTAYIVNANYTESFGGYYATAGALQGFQAGSQAAGLLNSCTIKLYGYN